MRDQKLRIRGSVLPRQNGRFTAVAPPTYDPFRGKKIRPSVGTFDTEEEAQNALARLEVEGPGSILPVAPATTTSTTLGDYLDGWTRGPLARRRELLHRRTIADYRATLRRHVDGSLRTTRLVDLDQNAILAWLDRLRRRGLSDRSVQKAWRLLHQTLEESPLSSNPASLPKPFRPRVLSRRRIVWPTVEDVRGFLDHVRQCNRRGASEATPMWELAAATGLRRSELLGLTWDHLDLDSDIPRLHVRQALHQRRDALFLDTPKSDAGERTVALPPDLRDPLRLLDRATWDRDVARIGPLEGADFVFRCGPDLGPTKPDWVTSWFAKEWRHARLRPGVTLHGLRRGHGSALLAAGVPVLRVAARLGHHPDVLLRLYARDLDEGLRHRDMADHASNLYFA